MVHIQRAVGPIHDGLGGEGGFIYVDDSIMLLFQMLDPISDLNPPILIFRFLGRIITFDKLDPFVADLIITIELSQESGIDAMFWELSVE